MKIDNLLNSSVIDLLLEAQKYAPNSEESIKQVKALKKKFNFDANLTLWDNYKNVPDKYKEQVGRILINHCQNLNKEIYKWIAENYDLGTIYWHKSDSSISQYVYFVLKNGSRLGIRVSDHTKQINVKAKTHLLFIYYNTSFNDILKKKIDMFIQKYSGDKDYKKIA